MWEIYKVILRRHFKQSLGTLRSKRGKPFTKTKKLKIRKELNYESLILNVFFLCLTFFVLNQWRYTGFH